MKTEITAEDPINVLKEMGQLCTQQTKLDDVRDMSKLSRKFGAIYAREFSGENGRRILATPISELRDAIKAADNIDANIGALTGSLITQRTLELLKVQFPGLQRFSSDFSDEGGQFGQTVISRIIGIPTAQDYDAANGWPDATATTVDVPVTIDKHKGVPITFNSNLLSGTMRNLFNESAPASAYALGYAMVSDLYANITDAKFANNTVQATAGFSRTTVIDLGTALTLRGVPQGEVNRTLLLYPTVFGALSKDTSLVTFAAFQRPQMFEQGRDGNNTAFAFPVHGFDVHEAVNLPTNNGNVTGFAGSKSALVISSRVPTDYTKVIPGASYGNASIVTDPDINLSIMLVQYVDHKKAATTQRMALMYGTAAGQTNAGQLLKAAAGTGSNRA